MDFNDLEFVLKSLSSNPDFWEAPDKVRFEAIDVTAKDWVDKQNPEFVSEDDQREIDRLKADTGQYVRTLSRAGRYQPSAEELMGAIGELNVKFDPDAPIKQQREQLDEIKEQAFDAGLQYDAKNAHDLGFAIEQQATHLRRTIDGKNKKYVGSLFSNALQGAASRLVTSFGGDDEGVREFFHENPIYDDRFGQKLASGIGDVGATLAMMYGSSYVGGTAASALGASKKAQDIAAVGSSVSTSLLSNSLVRYKEGFDAEMAFSGDAKKAESAGWSAVPAAGVDVLGDMLLKKFLSPSDKGYKSLKAATTAEAKRAIIKKFAPDFTKRVSAGFISEGAIEVAGDFTSGKMQYLQTGNPDAIPDGPELWDAFLIGGVIGGGIAAGGAGRDYKQARTTANEIDQLNLKSEQAKKKQAKLDADAKVAQAKQDAEAKAKSAEDAKTKAERDAKAQEAIVPTTPIDVSVSLNDVIERTLPGLTPLERVGVDLKLNSFASLDEAGEFLGRLGPDSAIQQFNEQAGDIQIRIHGLTNKVFPRIEEARAAVALYRAQKGNDGELNLAIEPVHTVEGETADLIGGGGYAIKAKPTTKGIERQRQKLADIAATDPEADIDLDPFGVADVTRNEDVKPVNDVGVDAITINDLTGDNVKTRFGDKPIKELTTEEQAEAAEDLAQAELDNKLNVESAPEPTPPAPPVPVPEIKLDVIGDVINFLDRLGYTENFTKDSARAVDAWNKKGGLPEVKKRAQEEVDKLKELFAARDEIGETTTRDDYGTLNSWENVVAAIEASESAPKLNVESAPAAEPKRFAIDPEIDPATGQWLTDEAIAANNADVGNNLDLSEHADWDSVVQKLKQEGKDTAALEAAIEETAADPEVSPEAKEVLARVKPMTDPATRPAESAPPLPPSPFDELNVKPEPAPEPTPEPAPAPEPEQQTNDAIEEEITEEEQVVLTEDLGFKEWSQAALNATGKHFADWLATGKAITKRVGDIFSRIKNKVISTVAALTIGAVIFNSSQAPTQSAQPAKAEYTQVYVAPDIPSDTAKVVEVEADLIEAVSTPNESAVAAEPAEVVASEAELAEIEQATPIGSVVNVKLPKRLAEGDGNPQVKSVALWVADTNNAKGKPFIIADKQSGQLHVFGSTGDLIEKTPALFGADIGDFLADKPMGEEKITPSGRFKTDYALKTAPDKRGFVYNSLVRFHETDDYYVALHRLYTGIPEQNRSQRIQTNTAGDNRVSSGCINCTDQVYNDTIVPNFRDGGVIYVLPETEAGANAFQAPGRVRRDLGPLTSAALLPIGVAGRRRRRKTGKEKKGIMDELFKLGYDSVTEGDGTVVSPEKAAELNVKSPPAEASRLQDVDEVTAAEQDAKQFLDDTTNAVNSAVSGIKKRLFNSAEKELSSSLKFIKRRGLKSLAERRPGALSLLKTFAENIAASRRGKAFRLTRDELHKPVKDLTPTDSATLIAEGADPNESALSFIKRAADQSSVENRVDRLAELYARDVVQAVEDGVPGEVRVIPSLRAAHTQGEFDWDGNERFTGIDKLQGWLEAHPVYKQQAEAQTEQDAEKAAEQHEANVQFARAIQTELNAAPVEFENVPTNEGLKALHNLSVAYYLGKDPDTITDPKAMLDFIVGLDSMREGKLIDINPVINSIAEDFMNNTLPKTVEGEFAALYRNQDVGFLPGFMGAFARYTSQRGVQLDRFSRTEVGREFLQATRAPLAMAHARYHELREQLEAKLIAIYRKTGAINFSAVQDYQLGTSMMLSNWRADRDPETEFKRIRELIVKSIDTLYAGDLGKKRQAESMTEALETVLGNAETREDFIKGLSERVDPAVLETADLIRDLHEELLPDLQFITEAIRNKPFERWNNYSRFSQYNPDGSNGSPNHSMFGVEDIDFDSFTHMPTDYGKQADPTKSQGSTTKNRSLALREGHIYQLSGKAQALQGIRLSAYESETAADRITLAAVVRSDQFIEAISKSESGPDNINRATAVRRALADEIKAEIASTSYVGDFDKAVETTLGGVGTILLSRVHRVLSEPLAAYSDFFIRNINNPAKLGVLIKVPFVSGGPNVSNLLNSLGFNRRSAMGELALREASNDFELQVGKLGTMLGRNLQVIRDIAGKPLQLADHLSAKSIFLAEYIYNEMQRGAIRSPSDLEAYLADGGVNATSAMKAMEATDRIVNSTISSARGNAFQSYSGKVKWLRYTLFAFASHSAATANQGGNATRNLVASIPHMDGAEIARSVRTIGALAAQSIAYRAAYAVPLVLLAAAIKGHFRESQDDEEIAKKQARQFYLSSKGSDKRTVAEEREFEELTEEIRDLIRTRDAISKFEQRKTSGEGVLKRGLKDAAGSLLLYSGMFPTATDASLGAVIDPGLEKSFRVAKEEEKNSLTKRISKARKLGDFELAGKLKLELEDLEAVEPILFGRKQFGLASTFPGVFGIPIDNAFSSTEDIVKGYHGVEEVNYNDWILSLQAIGLGQGDVNEVLRFIDGLENSEFKRAGETEKKDLREAEEEAQLKAERDRKAALFNSILTAP